MLGGPIVVTFVFDNLQHEPDATDERELSVIVRAFTVSVPRDFSSRLSLHLCRFAVPTKR
jgi:hypothetical protein